MLCEIISTSTRIYQTVFLPLGSIHIKRKRTGETEFVQSCVFICSCLSNSMLTGLGSNVFSAPRELYFLLCHEPKSAPAQCQRTQILLCCLLHWYLTLIG